MHISFLSLFLILFFRNSFKSIFIPDKFHSPRSPSNESSCFSKCMCSSICWDLVKSSAFLTASSKLASSQRELAIFFIHVAASGAASLSKKYGISKLSFHFKKSNMAFCLLASYSLNFSLNIFIILF